jgi:hypothetical protein
MKEKQENMKGRKRAHVQSFEFNLSGELQCGSSDDLMPIVLKSFGVL